MFACDSFKINVVKTSVIKSKQAVLITASLFQLENGYKPWERYYKGLNFLISKISGKSDIVLRLYYDGMTDELFDELFKHNNVELHKYSADHMADRKTGNQGVFGALLRYLPLFFAEKNYRHAFVMDLDNIDEMTTEFLGYIEDIKKYDFVYSCRTWYRSGRYWYDRMAYKSFFHLVRGWGLGFRTGLLHPALFMNFIEECSLGMKTTDKTMYRFKQLSYEAINNESARPKDMTILECDTFPYGIVELFTTFYVLPVILLSKFKVMRIDVQYGILHCLAQDLYQTTPSSIRDEVFQREFNMPYDTYIKKLRHIYDGRQVSQILWSDFLNLTKSLIDSKKIKVDAGLWRFLYYNNSRVISYKNNRVIVDKDLRPYLYDCIYGPSY